jgi:hypothetical protein
LSDQRLGDRELSGVAFPNRPRLIEELGISSFDGW